MSDSKGFTTEAYNDYFPEKYISAGGFLDVDGDIQNEFEKSKDMVIKWGSYE